MEDMRIFGREERREGERGGAKEDKQDGRRPSGGQARMMVVAEIDARVAVAGRVGREGWSKHERCAE